MQNLMLKIRESQSGLDRNSARIASFILAHGSEITKMTIKQLSDGSGVSESAVVRFCKMYGLRGYKDFRRELTASFLEEARGSDTEKEYRPMDITGGEDISEIGEQVAANSIQSIRETKNLLDGDTLKQAIEILDKAPRIDFYGSGASGIVAQDAHQKFIRIGKTCNVSRDSHIQITLASSLKKKDVAIVISYSGQTRDAIQNARIAKANGATVIGITKFGSDNPLASIVDIVLYTTSPETLIRSSAASSRIAQLTVIDILFTGVVSRNLGKYQTDLENSYKYAAMTKIRK